MLNDQIIAAIRTASAVWGPALIVALVTTLTSLGVDIQIDQSWGVALAGLLFALLVGLYNFAVGRLPASQASAFVNLIPLFTLFFAAVVLGETLSAQQLAGAALVFVGVALSQWRRTAVPLGA